MNRLFAKAAAALAVALFFFSSLGYEVALFFAAFPSNALTGQSLVVSHGWYMQ